MRWVKQAVGYGHDNIIESRYLGEGICAAVLDTGISRHPDLEGRIVGFKILQEAARSVMMTVDMGRMLREFWQEEGKYQAGCMRDGASCQPADRKSAGPRRKWECENVLKGIEWVLEEKDRYGVRIVNISVGTQPDLAEGQKQLFLNAVERLWDSGLVVVVSAGNYGPGEGTVAVPGSSRKVITVGVPDSELPPVQRRRKNMNYSGRGPTKECVVKPDVFSPGTGIISSNGKYGRPGEHPYTMKTGTSMATPIVSGAVACLLSKYPDMTNVEVKLKLRESCVKIPGTEAGWGMLNVERLMKV